MLADIMPNILALAPFESVFGLACSCRALSRAPIERAKYEVERPITLDDVAGTMIQYPNGWRLRARIASIGNPLGAIIDVVYKNNAPLIAYTAVDDEAWVMSLVTRVYCMIDKGEFRVRRGMFCDDRLFVFAEHTERSTSVDDRVARTIATAVRPLLFLPPNVVTADTVRIAVKVMNVFARHIGEGGGCIFAGPMKRALDALVAGHI